MKFISLVLFSLLSFNLLGGEHQRSVIKGKEIKLSTQGHAIAGHIGDKLVFGVVGGNHHDKSTLKIHDHGKVTQTSFEQLNGVWGGSISDEKKSSRIEFKSFNKESEVFVITFDGKEYEVEVDYDRYEKNHFINPRYTLNYNDKKLKIKMKKGEACKKYSLHLIFMIFGTFLHGL